MEENVQAAEHVGQLLFALVFRIQVRQLGHRMLTVSSDENRAVRLGRVS